MEIFNLSAEVLLRFVWLMIFLGWLVEVIFLGRNINKDSVIKIDNPWKCRLFGILVVCIFALTFLPGESRPIISKIFGLPLCFTGCFLHWRARVCLGENWSSEARIRSQHRLVRQGAYALVRHPIYLSEILIGLATALVFANWFIFFLVIILIGTAFYQIGIEEKLLKKYFGKEMENYIQSTPKLFPNLSSIKRSFKRIY